MYPLLLLFVLSMGFGCDADGFDSIKPSANLTWTSCFNKFGCSKLEVPIDYSNKSLGTTHIAFLRLIGKNATANSPSIVLLPGGPGNSGIDLLLSTAPLAEQLLGPDHNIISFDPRGVNNSGLPLDCFPNNPAARQEFLRLHSTGVTNLSTPSVEQQYYSSSIYGAWCSHAVRTNSSPSAYHVTTPAVARDLLTFVEANARATGASPADAKLWAYGVSYGTVTGSTFAAMFPGRVGRMVLDGVVNAEEYYGNVWRENVDQMDEGMAEFARSCHAAGEEKCAVWAASPGEILRRMDSLIEQLEEHPIPLPGLPHNLPALATVSDLKALFLSALYAPVSSFPRMAEVLSELERGNASGLAGQFASLGATFDARLAIMCADSYRTDNLTSLDAWRDYVQHTTAKSKYLGDLWPIYQDPLLCREMGVELPDSMMAGGPIAATNPPTAFPILFTSNTIDPITPLISAQKMSTRFTNSILLKQKAVGHTISNQGASPCYVAHVRAYFAGVLPKANQTCDGGLVPFVDGV